MPLVELSYNNNFQISIRMAPYEALYDRKCRPPICWDDVGERKLLGPDLVQATTRKDSANIGEVENNTKSTKKSMQTTKGENWNFKWVIMSS